MKHPYRVGYHFEIRVANWFKAHNYEIITSRGSHGKADLWALKKNPPDPPGTPIPVLIQCKVAGPRVRINRLTKEQLAFKDYANTVKARAIWAWRKGRKLMIQALN